MTTMILFPTLTSDLKKRLLHAHVLIIMMICIGTICFHFIEGLSWSNSLYLTSATVTTVGYGDIYPVTPQGRLFTTVFMLAGVGLVLYALSILAQAFIQTEVFSALGIRRKNKEMDNLSDHFIICGAGRVGRRIITSFNKEGIPFVVIEQNESRLERLELGGNQYELRGDATLEANLIQAGVGRARGLAACLAEDAANLYVVLTARNLNENLHIVSRAVEEQAEPRLIQAGANRVVAPTIIGSLSMARALTKPAIADFMDSIVAENLDLVFEELAITPRSKYVGQLLKETNLSRELNLLIVAIRRQNGEMIFNPSSESRILEHDLLIVIGNAESMQKFMREGN